MRISKIYNQMCHFLKHFIAHVLTSMELSTFYTTFSDRPVTREILFMASHYTIVTNVMRVKGNLACFTCRRSWSYFEGCWDTLFLSNRRMSCLGSRWGLLSSLLSEAFSWFSSYGITHKFYSRMIRFLHFLSIRVSRTLTLFRVP